MHYHKLGYLFERHGGSGGSDALLKCPDEALNFRDMLLFGCTVQVYDQRGNFLAQWFKLTISVHVCDLETAMQVLFMCLCDSICNVLNFSVFGHTSSGKHDVSYYGVEEADSIDVHEVTAHGDLFVLIKDVFGNTCYLNGIHMLYLAPHCLDFQVWYTRPIDVLSHSDILYQDWKVLQDVIINCTEDSLYWLTSDVLVGGPYQPKLDIGQVLECSRMCIPPLNSLMQFQKRNFWVQKRGGSCQKYPEYGPFFVFGVCFQRFKTR